MLQVLRQFHDSSALFFALLDNVQRLIWQTSLYGFPIGISISNVQGSTITRPDVFIPLVPWSKEPSQMEPWVYLACCCSLSNNLPSLCALLKGLNVSCHNRCDGLLSYLRPARSTSGLPSSESTRWGF